MLLKMLAAAVFAGITMSPGLSAQAVRAPQKMSAAEIVERNIAARGGLQAWRSVQALSMTGAMEAGGNTRTALPMPGRKDSRFMPPARPTEQARLPFVMKLKRPGKTRVEVKFNGQTAIQIYDGAAGWKLRPFLNRHQVEPYTEEEMKTVSAQADLDGPLVDYARKGTTIELLGTENVEGRAAYKIKLITRSGTTTQIWIDATNFLELKMQGSPRRLDGKYHPVEIYYRDYRTVAGLQFPFLIETRVLNPPGTLAQAQVANSSEKIFLDSVQINPALTDASFTRADMEVPPVSNSTVTRTNVKAGQ